MEQKKGGCFCGNVRYAVIGEPLSISICHCTSCKKSAGAPSVAWAVYALNDFRIIKGDQTFYSSSPSVRRGHCSVCGTSLTFFELGEDTVDVTIASMDDPDQIIPTKEIWLSHRLAWEEVSNRRARFVKGSPNAD
jgi:hypothetical protein